MHFHVSDDTTERLNQLNALTTELVFGFDQPDENKCLLAKMNLSKWKAIGYSISVVADAAPAILNSADHLILYNAFNIIGELLLFRKEQNAAVIKQDYEKAAHFRDRQKQLLENLKVLHATLASPIPFFSTEGNLLSLGHIDQHYVKAYILHLLVLE